MIRLSDHHRVALPPRLRWQAVTWGAVSVFVLTLALSCSSSKAVDRLTIVNLSPFDVEVDVTDSSKESWLILGTAQNRSSTVSQLVTDMGGTWIFRFHHGGREVGELTVTRQQLVRNRWRVEVPSAVADELRRLGFEPQPEP